MDHDDYIILTIADNLTQARQFQTLLEDYDIEAIISKRDPDADNEITIKVPEDQIDDARDILERINDLSDELEYEYFDSN
ncbi:MAG: hypothetical protein JEZ07_00675 [Phycisphaerae bacterium]|nr:hypothetical protein [Phycisphaerae bacterium]